MRLYDMPDGKKIDLDAVVDVDPLFINKNYPKFNCYEVHLSNGKSFGVFDKDLNRDEFIAAWEGV